jgi:hypothetical protein
VLRLYPDTFQKTYAEQMLLTAEDVLQEAHTRSAVAKVAGRLVVDALVTMVKENSKQLGSKVMKRIQSARHKTKRALAVQVLQLLGIAGMTYVSISFALINFNALRRINPESFWGDGYIWRWSGELIAAAVPLLLVPLAFVMVYGIARLTLWQKVVWAYGLGALGTVCLLFVFFVANKISINLTSQQHDYQWLLAIVFLGGYYLSLREFQKRVCNSSTGKRQKA